MEKNVFVGWDMPGWAASVSSAVNLMAPFQVLYQISVTVLRTIFGLAPIAPHVWRFHRVHPISMSAFVIVVRDSIGTIRIGYVWKM